MLVGRGLAVVLGDLAEMGYDARWGVLGADDAGAPHRRKRIWILAHSGSFGSKARIPEPEQREEGVAKEPDHSCCGQGSGKNADPDQSRLERQERIGTTGEEGASDRHAAELCGQVAGTKIPITDSNGLEAGSGVSTGETGQRGAHGCNTERRTERSWWEAEPELGRVAHGVACRVDRLKAIGNGQVPQVAALAWRILAEDAQEIRS